MYIQTISRNLKYGGSLNFNTKYKIAIGVI